MWGTQILMISLQIIHRFIPTHVGNTDANGNPIGGLPVHPHACGEHVGDGPLMCGDGGSSPRMWGTPRSPPPGAPGARFIPTHVGNTRDMEGRVFRSSVHPHACGEHIHSHETTTVCAGSSPRMWGTQAPGPGGPAFWRFIPTHVGNTGALGGAAYSLSVHPHACGEHNTNHQISKESVGSSPRMWGTLYLIKTTPY